ncbi:MAG: tRNA-uridine aminocarboxypropyltransferase [Myxococcota bacterium]|nr:tRNA-uridine aminocarboxypropyltransferase [Myxococcota bacterium]
MTHSLQTEARPHCYRCDKPQSMCLCSYLRPIPNEVGVHILQHRREHRHALGTVRLLRLGLASVQVHVLDLQGKGGVSRPVALPEGSGLLYPSAEARDLATLTEEERPEHLVVIDGTWPQAHQICRDNPWLSCLPRYGLSPSEGSRYRIRTEPRLECLSTLESVVAALRCLQPDLEGTEMLDSAFDRMIDDQIAAAAQGSPRVREKRARGRVSQVVPAELSAADARIVVVYGEASPLRRGDPQPRSPIRLSAALLNGEGLFDRMIQARDALTAQQAGHLEVELHDFDTARPLDEVLAAFRLFCEEASSGAPLVLVSWGVWTHRWLQSTMGDVPCILLKGVWANISRDRVPDLDVVVSGLGIATPDISLRGRAGRRLSQASAMTRHILSSVASGS